MTAHDSNAAGARRRITILGAGAWGTAVAMALAARHDVMLWGRNADAMTAMAASGENPYLPGFALPPQLAISADFDAAVAHASGEHALLIQPHAGGPPDEGALEEFADLARSAGATVAAVLTARIDRPNAAMLIGSGKLEEAETRMKEFRLRNLDRHPNYILAAYMATPVRQATSPSMESCRYMLSRPSALDSR